MKRPAARPPEAPTIDAPRLPDIATDHDGQDPTRVQPGLLQIGLLAAIATIIFVAEILVIRDGMLNG